MGPLFVNTLLPACSVFTMMKRAHKDICLKYGETEGHSRRLEDAMMNVQFVLFKSSSPALFFSHSVCEYSAPALFFSHSVCEYFA